MCLQAVVIGDQRKIKTINKPFACLKIVKGIVQGFVRGIEGV
jgi:hypothetical protein